MFEILPVNEDGILAFRASGKLTRSDYEAFLPRLEALIRKHGTISLYIELEGFQGWEADAAWTDLRFGLQHDSDFRRIAIVGDSALEHWGTALANFFTRTQMRFFRKSDAGAAWDWLHERPEEQDEPRPVEAYRNILLATDFSRDARRAAQRAGEIRERYDASLYILHIVEPVMLYNEGADPVLADFPVADDTLFRNAEDSLRRFASQVKLEQVAGLEVQWGTPGWSIVSWAREKEIDLIVLGSHGRRGFGRLLGSVSSRVMNHAHCDVLVVKP